MKKCKALMSAFCCAERNDAGLPKQDQFNPEKLHEALVTIKLILVEAETYFIGSWLFCK